MLEYLFNYELTVNLLAVAGIYIVLLWLYENLRSPVQILINVVRPLFQPEYNKSLAERYGEWAGKHVHERVMGVPGAPYLHVDTLCTANKHILYTHNLENETQILFFLRFISKIYINCNFLYRLALKILIIYTVYRTKEFIKYT